MSKRMKVLMVAAGLIFWFASSGGVGLVADTLPVEPLGISKIADTLPVEPLGSSLTNL
jgi:hypothetical protein